MALIKGKQLAANTVTQGKADLSSATWNFATGRLEINSAAVATESVAQGYATTAQNNAYAYADALKAGLDIKDSVRVATAAALPACTAAGSDVGKTLTGNAAGILTVDGVALVLNNRVLVKDQATGADNGIYKVTTAGTAEVAFVLTRATDADDADQVTPGLYCFTEAGTANADAGFVLTTNGTAGVIDLDSDALSFTQFSGAGQITAGNGLTKDGNTIDVVVAAGSEGLVANADNLSLVYAGTDEVADIVIGAESAGTSTKIARGDHVHALSAGTPGGVAIGDSATTGTATTPAASDHVHSVAGGSPVTVGTTLGDGNATTFARANHVHSSPHMNTDLKGQAGLAVASGSTGQAITAQLATAVALGSCPIVIVNGMSYPVSGSGTHGTNTAAAFYISALADGSTSRAFGAMAATDYLIKGTGLGFALETDDVLDVNYLTL